MNFKRKNRFVRVVILIAVALVAIVGIGLFLLTSYFSSSAVLGEDPALTSVPDTVPVPEISDEELSKLLSGETTLQELESGFITGSSPASAGEQASPEKEDAASVSPASENASPSSGGNAASSRKTSSSTSTAPETSSSEVSSSEATTPVASSSSSNASHTASSVETVQEAAYEAEVKALLQELYTLRARAMSDLDVCIASAKAEFKALPEEQQTQTRKVSIVFSKAGQLTSLQSYYDKEVARIVSEMRRVLSENGQSTELADQAMASYKSQKNEKYAELINKLYEKSE